MESFLMDTQFGIDSLDLVEQTAFDFQQESESVFSEDSLPPPVQHSESMPPFTDAYYENDIFVDWDVPLASTSDSPSEIKTSPPRPSRQSALAKAKSEMERLGIRKKYSDGKRRHALPQKAIDEITQWIVRNAKNPYPSMSQKMQWCVQYDMPMCQVNTFLVNRRIRVLGTKSSRQVSSIASSLLFAMYHMRMLRA